MNPILISLVSGFSGMLLVCMLDWICERNKTRATWAYMTILLLCTAAIFGGYALVWHLHGNTASIAYLIGLWLYSLGKKRFCQ